jgi:hypothetical protein
VFGTEKVQQKFPRRETECIAHELSVPAESVHENFGFFAIGKIAASAAAGEQFHAGVGHPFEDQRLTAGASYADCRRQACRSAPDYDDLPVH